MNRLRFWGLALSLAVLGCYSNAEFHDAQVSCESYCAAYERAAHPTDGTTGCPAPIYSSEGGCFSAECEPFQGAKKACLSLVQTYYNCLAALPAADLCADDGMNVLPGCANEFAAVQSGC